MGKVQSSGASLLGALLVAALSLGPTPSRAQDPPFSEIERGRYLVTAGDCVTCHTAEGGKPFAGGRELPTPFGTIYAPNLTPDTETGIGGWSDEDFYRAMHEGKSPSGENYYPAFPYPWFTRLTRGDVRAIRTYLGTLEPVRNTIKPPELPWPLSWRPLMAAWNGLYFKEGTYAPDRSQSQEWNRGAYLVQGAAHCGACHTPRSVLGGTKTEQRLQGGYGEHWYAPNLTGDVRRGLGKWSTDDIVTYLKTGTNSYASASGPMAEVVSKSTQHLTDADLRAIAVYLKSTPAETAQETVAAASGDAVRLGEAVYVDNCTGCHRWDGKGQPGVIPPLAGNAVAQAEDPVNAVRAVLFGLEAARTAEKPTGLAMPSFGWKLTDADVANLVSYVRNSWGNAASVVDASKVSEVRKTFRQAKSAAEDAGGG